MTEPNFSINFTALMLAGTTVAVGDLLVYHSTTGYWKIATSANRTAADAGAQAVALTTYGGSLVGKITYQSSGVVANEVSGLGTGTKALVRTSTIGRFERIVGSPGASDDVVGYCETDGRVKLHLGIPWTTIAALASAPGLPLKSFQYNNANVLTGVTEHTYEGTGRENILGTGYITWGAVGSTYGSAGFLRVANIAETDYTLITHGANTVLALEPSAARAVTLGYSTGLTHLNGSTIRLSSPIIEAGTGTVATSGTVRFPVSSTIKAPNAAGTGNLSHLEHYTFVSGGNKDALVLGSDQAASAASQPDVSYLWAKSFAGFGLLTDLDNTLKSVHFCVFRSGYNPLANGTLTIRGSIAYPNLGVRSNVTAPTNDFWGGGDGVFRLDAATTNPSVNQTGCALLYVDATSDAFKMRKPVGHVSILGNELLPLTFATDANRALTAAESDATMVTVANGVITAQRDITSTLPPHKSRKVHVRNNNAFAVRWFWSTGTSVTIATNTSALISADNTNAVSLT